MKNLKNDLFIKACNRQPVERTPVWIMRQAGRYLPEYRAVRAKHDFLTMCKTPELAAEVTIQPVELIGVDAAIIFSDILVIPEAMGMHLEMYENRGPVFPNPIRTDDDASKLRNIDPYDDLNYVLETIKLVNKELDGKVPVIGFSGAPWTLLTYMVEGHGSKNFSNVKKLIYNNPELAHKLLDKISDAVAAYLNAQINSGVNAVQIFDTWAGILTPRDFLIFSLKYVSKIISQLNRNGQPVIYFPKGVHYRTRTVSDCGADVIGLDWTMDISKVRDKIGKKTAIQGNLDPTVLYADKNFIRREVRKVLENYGPGEGHIFNLGHGILPDVDPDNAKAMVEFVKEESVSFHKK
ncbi:MAG TPA: uroporphyrinogen decarboxylase [Ignavibacteriaceae bacterium]|nr:uroporphyrinogen decarboxylase [Ignavibacteriaceae bacterium]